MVAAPVGGQTAPPPPQENDPNTLTAGTGARMLVLLSALCLMTTVLTFAITTPRSRKASVVGASVVGALTILLIAAIAWHFVHRRI